MTSAHTQAILNDEPIYLTGAVTKIPVKGKRSYSHRIKVHKRRSIKPQLVKDELRFQQQRIARAEARIVRHHKPFFTRPTFKLWADAFLNRLKRKRG